uniref:DNA/RNA-binding domain-containing protein n=1 Tax=Trichuris muris TaxID=70415 RepID=A0A5S6Q980_TRIMR
MLESLRSVSNILPLGFTCRSQRETQVAPIRATAPDRHSDGDRKQLLRNQMDTTYFSCETLRWELNNRLNGEGTLGIYFDVNTIGLSIKLRSMYETIVLGDPQCLADDAEQLMWHHCFVQLFDPISRNATKMGPQQLRKAMELLHIASNYYFGLIRKLAKTGSREIGETVLSVPIALRWKNPKYEPQDAFVIEMAYRMYMHMGDIVRYRSVISPTLVYRAYPTADKLYQYALSLKREDSAPFSRLGMLCSSVGRPIEAACYHFRGSRAQIQSDVSAQYLTLLLTENERHYYLAAEKRKATDQREAEENVSEMFVFSSLRIIRYLYSSTGKSQDCYLPAMVKENIRILGFCFEQLRKRRFPGYLYRDVNSDAILSLVAMQMELIKLLEENDSAKRLIAERWLLSVFRLVVELCVDVVCDLYSTVPSLNDFKSSSRSTNVSLIPPNLQSVNSGGHKASVSKLMTASQKVKARRGEVENHELTKAACIIIRRKLKVLSQFPWLKVVKVVCNWLQLHPDKLHKMNVDSWTQFVSLANLLPNELELTDVYSYDKKLSKKVGGLFLTPLSEWTQEISLPEDAFMFDIIQLPLHQKISDRSMDDSSLCFLRICCLHKYAREFVRLKFTGLKFDNWINKYVPPSSSHDGSTEAPMKRLETVSTSTSVITEPVRGRVTAYGHLNRSCRPSIFLIVDVFSLCDNLPLMKDLAQSNEFTIVICISVIDQLHEWKAGMHGARDAINWLDYEWVHSNRAILVRTSDTCSEKWEGEQNDPTLELVLMYDLLVDKPPYNVRQVLLLTDYGKNSENFKNIHAQARENGVEDIDVRNVEEFYVHWSSKRPMKYY